MPLETGTSINDLVVTNPVAGDNVAAGDDHLRLIKSVLKTTLPGFAGTAFRTAAKTSAYTMLSTDNTVFFNVGASASGTATISLPAIASVSAGFTFTLRAGDGAAALLDPNGAETINSASAISVLGNQQVICFAGASQWHAVTIPYSTYGQLPFPATQVASADANTLDDYEEGTWTPTLGFATPGDQSIAYSVRFGAYTKVGRVVHLTCQIVTSTFTHTTAAGSLLVSGLPFTASSAEDFVGSVTWALVTGSGRTQLNCRVLGGGTTLDFPASGENVGSTAISATNCPTGSTMTFQLNLTYYV